MWSFPQKVKNGMLLWSNNLSTGYLLWGNVAEEMPAFQCSLQRSSQLPAFITNSSICQLMSGLKMLYRYTMEYYSAIQELNPAICDTVAGTGTTNVWHKLPSVVWPHLYPEPKKSSLRISQWSACFKGRMRRLRKINKGTKVQLYRSKKFWCTFAQ